MDFFELVNKRESVRGYLDKKVEREKILKIVEAARMAPSACNAQPWKFILVDDENKVKEIANNLKPWNSKGSCVSFIISKNCKSKQ